MKILLVASQMNTGGTESLTVRLANEFVKKKKCSLFVIKKESGKLIPFLSKSLLIKYGEKSLFSSVIKLKQFIDEYEPSIILCQSNYSYLLIKLALLFKSGPRVFLALHYTYKYGLKSNIMNWFVFSFVKHSKDVLIASYEKQIKLFSERHGIKKERFTRIYNGIEIAENLINKNNLSEIVKFIHVANFREEKDQITLLNALTILNKKNKNWKLYFRGVLPPAQKKHFDEFILQNNLNLQVEFIEYAETVYDLYNDKDVFVLSSKTEALPMTIIEAMSFKIPCIVTDVGGCSEIIEDNKNGFVVKAQNPELIAEKMLFYLEHRERITIDGLHAYERAKSIFSLEKTINEYLKTFNTYL